MTCKNKNLQFEIQCGLRASSTRLYHYILERVDKFKPTEIFFDLKEFNRYIFKTRGRPYDRKTVKEAIAQLDEKTFGRFTIVKTFHWHLLKIRVLPLKMAIAKKREMEQEEKSQSGDLSPKPKRRNPKFSDAHTEWRDKLLQQNLSKQNILLKKIDLDYGYSSLKRIWEIVGQEFNEVQRGIELMLYQNSVKPGSIKNPKAWLVDCLKNRYYENFDLYYSPELPRFESKTNLGQFVREVFEGVKLCPE